MWAAVAVYYGIDGTRSPIWFKHIRRGEGMSSGDYLSIKRAELACVIIFQLIE